MKKSLRCNIRVKWYDFIRAERIILLLLVYHGETLLEDKDDPLFLLSFYHLCYHFFFSCFLSTLTLASCAFHSASNPGSVHSLLYSWKRRGRMVYTLVADKKGASTFDGWNSKGMRVVAPCVGGLGVMKIWGVRAEVQTRRLCLTLLEWRRASTIHHPPADWIPMSKSNSGCAGRTLEKRNNEKDEGVNGGGKG